MKINSDFHDYYDTALGYGVDTTIHYNRKGRGYAPEGMPETLLKPMRHRSVKLKDETVIRPLVVGFCGVLHPAVEIFRGKETSPDYLYDVKHLLTFASDKGLRERGYARVVLGDFLRWDGKRCDTIFQQVSAPVFVVSREREYDDELTLRINVMLRKFQFYKVVDAFSAFQEISRYLSNELVRRDEPLEVADKYRIAQHGYDKYSFRKESTRR